MTHMHIPDGILPVAVWLLGFALMALAMAVCLFSLRHKDLTKKIPLLGAISAAMLVAMSLEIVPLAYHINLSVVAGILLGPALGFLAAFITNLMLALMGHGGITVIGLNTLLLGAEAVLGHTLFFFLPRKLPVFWRAVVATVLTLIITTTALIGIVAASHVDPGLMRHGDEGESQYGGPLSVSRFALLVFTLGVLGWIIEAAITGAVVSFIARVKPDLLGHVLHLPKTDAESDR